MIYKKKMILFPILVTLFLLSIFSCQSAGDKGVDASNTGNQFRVLFVGNSLTYYWDMPLQVESLALDLGADPELRVQQAAPPGAGLLKHLSPEYSDTLEVIRTGGFNTVVIQGTLLDPVENPTKFLKNTAAMANEVKASGGNVVFFETWAPDPEGRDIEHANFYKQSWSPKSFEEWQLKSREMYTRAASETNSRIACVGDAWIKVLAEHPDIILYNRDGCHPTECGSYLTACVFVNILTNLDPRDTEWRSEGVSEEEAVVLRAAAWEVSSKL